MPTIPDYEGDLREVEVTGHVGVNVRDNVVEFGSDLNTAMHYKWSTA